MTTVYCVWSGYEDMDGVFSTKEGAQEYVRRMVATGNYGKDQFSICDYDLDALLNNSQERNRE